MMATEIFQIARQTHLPTDNDDTLDGIFVDVDLDGDLDIYVANVMLQTISNQKIYINDGSGKYTDGTADDSSRKPTFLMLWESSLKT